MVTSKTCISSSIFVGKGNMVGIDYVLQEKIEAIYIEYSTTSSEIPTYVMIK